jgi:hypothetical protein
MEDDEQNHRQCKRCFQFKPLTEFREFNTPMESKLTNNCLKCLEKIRTTREIKFEIDHGIQHNYICDPQTIKIARYLCDYDELCKVVKNYIKNKYPNYIFRVIDRLDHSDFEVVFIDGSCIKYKTTQYYAKHFPNLECIEKFTIDEMDNEVPVHTLRIETRFSEDLYKCLLNGAYRYLDLTDDKIRGLTEILNETKKLTKIDRDYVLYQMAEELEIYMCREFPIMNPKVYDLLKTLNDNYPQVSNHYYINQFKFENGICKIDWGC